MSKAIVGGPELNTSKDKIIDVWMMQSAMMWRTVYTTPFVGIAIFAGWYSVRRAGEPVLAQTILLLGVVMMLIQFAILYRMSQYLNALRQEIGGAFPTMPKPKSGLYGYRIVRAIPLLLTVLFILLLVMPEAFLVTISN